LNRPIIAKSTEVRDRYNKNFEKLMCLKLKTNSAAYELYAKN
jgi:hypothetical protein